MEYLWEKVGQRAARLRFSRVCSQQLENASGLPVWRTSGFVEIVLFEPKIPQNTGNIIRLCACTGARLTIVGEPAFSMDDAHMRRAGLDYFREISIERRSDWQDFLTSLEAAGRNAGDLVFLSRFGSRPYSDYRFTMDQIFVFGNEPDGLPPEILDEVRQTRPDHLLRIPVTQRCRSLNLANAATLLVYECLRQNDYPGLKLDLGS